MYLQKGRFTNNKENSGPTFHVIKPNCETLKGNVYYAGTLEWNSLNSEVRNLPDLYTFKRNQKTWLLNTYLDFKTKYIVHC